jgi:uncharacterized DUF497 family protein
MEFSWDPAKSVENLRLRGFDYEFAALVFQGATLEREDSRLDYGEKRVIAVGVADGVELTVVFTDRPHAGGGLERRIISARRSNRFERQAYQASLEARRPPDEGPG